MSPLDSYTSDDLQTLLAVSQKQLRWLRRQGGLPHLPVGKGYRYPKQQVDDWYVSQLRVNLPAAGERLPAPARPQAGRRRQLLRAG